MINVPTLWDIFRAVWLLVGSMLGLYLLIGLLEGIINGIKRCHGGKKHEAE